MFIATVLLFAYFVSGKAQFFYPASPEEFQRKFLEVKKLQHPSNASDFLVRHEEFLTLQKLYRSNGSTPWKIAELLCNEIDKYKIEHIREQCAQNIKESACAFVELLGAELTDCAYNETCQQWKEAVLYETRYIATMLDSFGKIPAGVLKGNNKWLGDYQTCKSLEVEVPVDGSAVHKFRGQYGTAIIKTRDKNGFCQYSGPFIGLCVPSTCNSTEISTVIYMIHQALKLETCVPVAIVEEQPRVKDDVAAIVMLALAAAFACVMLVATIYDIWFYQPAIEKLPLKKPEDKTSTVWSTVLPSATGISQWNTQLNQQDIRPRNANNNLQVPPLNVNSTNAHWEAPDDNVESTSELVKKTVKTKAEYYNDLGMGWKSLLAFSVYTNGTKLFNTDHKGDTLECVHGVRFLSMAWVILGHCYVFSVYYLDNPMQILEQPKEFLFQLINNATVSVDTFFVLSGFLLSYLFLKRAQDNNGKDLKAMAFWKAGLQIRDFLNTAVFWIMYYVHRFLRLTPVYMLVLGLATTLWPYFTSGPMYDHKGTGIVNDCPKYWWRNLLYINNFFEEGQYCINWVWYLANDMQFYWFAPPILILFWFLPVVGHSLCVALIITSSALRAWMVLKNDYYPINMATANPGLYKGDEDGRFFFDVYIKPWMRLGPYVVGLMTGWLVFRTKRQLRISKWIVLLIWLVSTATALAVIFGMYNYALGNRITDTQRGIYTALCRTAWGAAICMVLFMCLNGYGGIANTILSWGVWVPLSRLTYAAYLIHEIVIAVLYQSMQTPFHGTTYGVVYNFFGSLVVTYVLALGVSLAFEAPFMQLEKLWLDTSKWPCLKRKKKRDERYVVDAVPNGSYLITPPPPNAPSPDGAEIQPVL